MTERLSEDTALFLSDKVDIAETTEDLDKKALVLLFLIIILFFVFYELVAW